MSSTDLPPHYWQTTKSSSFIETFRQTHNLTLVTSHPTDAALHPSWPQLLVAFAIAVTLVTLIICLGLGSIFSLTASPTSDDRVSSREKWRIFPSGAPLIRTLVIIPFVLFQLIIWIAGFAISQRRGTRGGWISVTIWSIFSLGSLLSIPGAILFTFYWIASLLHLIWRWNGAIGSVAYLITDLRGCTPHDGLEFLQAGRRGRPFRIFQVVLFVAATVDAMVKVWRVVRSWGSSVKARESAIKARGSARDNQGSTRKDLESARKDQDIARKDQVKVHHYNLIGYVSFALLVYVCYVGNAGTPLVVSGDCLLVEANPRYGFLDSTIGTTWKALSFFV